MYANEAVSVSYNSASSTRAHQAVESILEPFTLKYKNQAFQEIELIEKRGEYWIPVAEVLEEIGLSVLADTNSAFVHWAAEEIQQSCLIQSQPSRFICNTKVTPIYGNHLIYKDRVLYLKAGILHEMLPIRWKIDEAQQTIHLSVTDYGDGDAHLYFEELLENKYIQLQPPPPPLLQSLPQNNTPTAAPPQDKMDFLILQIEIDGATMVEFLEVIQKKNALYFPFIEIAELLDFAVDIDAETGTGDGWLIRENNTLTFDQDQYTFRGKTERFPPESRFMESSELFIRQDVIEKWLPIRFEIDTATMTVMMQTSEPLIFQQKQERDKRREKLARNVVKPVVEEEFPEREILTPYSFWDYPVVNVSLDQSYQNNTDTAYNTGYSIQSTGDFAFFSTDTFITGGSKTQSINDMRIVAERWFHDTPEDYDFLPNYIQIGDIRSETLPLAIQSGTGLGFRISREMEQQGGAFSFRDFTGDAIPGWDVELYRNNTLLASIVVGADGSYEFLDIPIFFGTNRFRIVFYGPQGQRQEEVYPIIASNSFLKPNDWSYSLSFDQIDQSTFEVLQFLSEDEDMSQSQNRVVGAVRYGLTENLTVSLGHGHTSFNGGVQDYSTLELRSAFGSVLSNFTFAHDWGEGFAAEALFLGNIWDTQWRLEHTHYFDFINDSDSLASNPLDYTTALSLSRSWLLSSINQVQTNLRFEQQQPEIGDLQQSLDTTVSTSLGGVYISNTTETNFGKNSQDTTGQLAFRSRWGDGSFRLDLGYDVDPKWSIRDTRATVQIPIDDKWSSRSTIRHIPKQNNFIQVGQSILHNEGRFQMSLDSTLNSEKEFYVGLGLNFSLRYLPEQEKFYLSERNMTNFGAVHIRAYEDKNLNKTHDADEPWLDEGLFDVNKRSYALEDVDGVTVPFLPAPKRMAVTMDSLSLSDPILAPAHSGYTIMTRKALTTNIEFPVWEYSEIDGEISYINGLTARSDLLDKDVILLDENNTEVARVQTEFDGYFRFDRVLPGDYTLVVEPIVRDGVEYIVKQPYAINISEPDFYENITLPLVRVTTF